MRWRSGQLESPLDRIVTISSRCGMVAAAAAAVERAIRWQQDSHYGNEIKLCVLVWFRAFLLAPPSTPDQSGSFLVGPEVPRVPPLVCFTAVRNVEMSSGVESDSSWHCRAAYSSNTGNITLQGITVSWHSYHSIRPQTLHCGCMLCCCTALISSSSRYRVVK